MTLCHLYSKKIESKYIQRFLKKVDESTSIDIDTIEKVDDCDIYLLEFYNVTKSLAHKLQNMLQYKKESLVYVFIPEKYTLSLFQLAFLLEAKSIITPKQNIEKIINKMEMDLLVHQEQYQSLQLGNMMINSQNYMIFKNAKLSFASPRLLREYGCQSLEDVQEKICAHLPLDELVVNNTGIKREVSKKLEKNMTHFIQSITHNDTTAILIERQDEFDVPCLEFSFVTSRVDFVEFLKDKLIEKIISEQSYSLVTLKFSITKEAIDKISLLAFEEFKKDFLRETNEILNTNIMISEYDDNFYVLLFENINFSDLKILAYNFRLQINSLLNKQSFKFSLGIHIIDLQTLELDDALTLLSKLASDKLEEKDVAHSYIEYIDSYQENMSEPQVVNFLLNSALINNASLKLINLYKGIVIETPSKIFHIDNGNITVSATKIQASVMEKTKSVVIKASTFAKEIKAQVLEVNFEDKYAILSGYKILNYNINSRQHGRVCFPNKKVVAVSIGGTKIKGELIDISMASVSFNIQRAKVLENILNKTIGLSFYLEDKYAKKGEILLKETAVVVHSIPNNDGTLKLICVFEENSENERTLIEYIYKMQKKIIEELSGQ